VLITGEVDRVTGFEKGFPIHQAWRGGSWQPDPLILDDQALIAHVAGHGLVVLTGCGHAGVINICRYAQRLTGTGKLHAVIGGFHLTGPLFEPIIADTVSALGQLAPDLIVPAHCTGWKATTRSPAACPPRSSRTASAPPSTSLQQPQPRDHGRAWPGPAPPQARVHHPPALITTFRSPRRSHGKQAGNPTDRRLFARHMLALPPRSVTAAECRPVPDGAATVSIPAPG
jgi:hypothetical protein